MQLDVDPLDDLLFESKTNNSHKFRPKMKAQPRKGGTRGVESDFPNLMDRTVLRSIEEDPSLSAVQDSLQSEDVVTDGNGDWQSSLGKSLGENADIFSVLECLDDFITETTCDLGSETSKPQSKVHTDENLSFPAHPSFDSSSFTICDVAPSQICSDYHSTQDPVSFSNTTVSDEPEEAQSNDGRSKTMVAEDLFDFEVYEGNVASGQCVGKFQPNPKLGKGKKKPSTREPQAEVSSGVPYVHNVPQVNSILEFPSEGDAEPTNFAKATYSEVVEDDPVVEEVGGKSIIGESSAEPNGLRRSQRSSAAMQEIEEDLGQLFEEEDNDEEYRVDNKSKKKKAIRKLEEPASGKEKPVRKRKRSKQASEEKIREPPKKFSHSTRRKKRIVDQALLEMPEDEIDPQRLPIKDLILLAEHRERVAIKDAAKLKTPQTNKSADDSFRQGVSHNEEMFHSEQGQNSDDEQPTYSAQPSSSYVNYHSFMGKTPSTRWSKNDTELFYEAVQQIGTDFSIIQQLFPNRTRKQLKMKFKKEERQHPLRLSDSLNDRSKDHSHFESVIKRLQELAAQAKQEAIGNESNWHPGEEEMEEPTHNANEEHTKSELDVVVKDQEQKTEVTDLQNSPLKYDEGDDDPDRWNNYDDY
ncbi:hypothetical protein CsatB_015582 [Cannabis sativa]